MVVKYTKLYLNRLVSKTNVTLLVYIQALARKIETDTHVRKDSIASTTTF